MKDRNEAIAPETSAPDLFEVFCAEQATKDYELSYEEIQAGIVDGEHDGGIDAFYTFVGGEVGFKLPKKTTDLEVIIIQSKSSSGFSEAPIDKMISSIRRLLDLSQDYDELTQYNTELKSRAKIFQKSYNKLLRNFPSLKIKIIYASIKPADNIHENTILKANELIDVVKSLFDEADVTFKFWGAKELVSLARTRPTQTFQLIFDQSLNGTGGYVTLVKLPNFYKFLLGGGSKIRFDLFEENVRDYQGSTEVNKDISDSLENGVVDENGLFDDFWWFNNGITVLASRATSSGSIITIENPQIINGLQTSSKIGRFFSEVEKDDPRSVMVKVVSSEDKKVRDKIIKATNNQNKVPLASLKATNEF